MWKLGWLSKYKIDDCLNLNGSSFRLLELSTEFGGHFTYHSQFREGP